MASGELAITRPKSDAPTPDPPSSRRCGDSRRYRARRAPARVARRSQAPAQWLAVAPIFLRETGIGRSLLEHALPTARSRAAIGALPFVLNLIARDDATTDHWISAEANYREAIDLARENDQRTDLVFGLSGLAWLLARRGAEQQCRACATEALGLCNELGTRLHELWTIAALGELELGLGDAAKAAERFEHQQQVLHELAITDVASHPPQSASTPTSDSAASRSTRPRCPVHLSGKSERTAMVARTRTAMPRTAR